MIAYLGTGLLGSGFVKAFLKKGKQVNVWNRTHSKAEVLAVDGAAVFHNITDAVAGCSRIHLTLKDDNSVDEVLASALPALVPGAVIIDHTTTSVAGARARVASWAANGFTYIHAPVFMGPINSLESTGYMLVSGNQQLLQAWIPELEQMTGKVINFGDDPGRAAGMKLAGNLYLISMTGGVADTLALVKAMGMPASDLTALFSEWNPGAMMPARLKRLMTGNFDEPSWELNMARKDAGLMMAEAHDKVNLMVIPSIAAEMDKFIAEGLGAKDWMVVGKESL